MRHLPKLSLIAVAALGTAFALSSCSVNSASKRDHIHEMRVSVPDQKMGLFREGALVRTYPISTSKFGVGDTPRSFRTPTGKMEVAEKIGDGKPLGAVFKSRKWTGEVLRPNSPGRDPI
ncbi:MAG: L,D-transpeptidase, partial [Verrucomicrobiota bacterium]